MANQITSEGPYAVKVTAAWIDPSAKDETCFDIVLKGETSDGFTGFGRLHWNRTVRNGGKDDGKTNAQVVQRTLAELGVADGYPPNLPAAIDAGLACQMVFKWEEYQGKKQLKCAYINPVSRMIDVHQVDWGATMKAFETGKPATAPSTNFGVGAAPASSPAASEQSPFNADAQSEPLPF